MTLDALATTRDVVLIIWGVISIFAFLFFIFFLWTTYRGLKGLFGNVRLVVNEDVRPLLGTTRESLNNVTGTTRFVSDVIVAPSIRAVGTLARIRRTLMVLLGLARRTQGDER